MPVSSVELMDLLPEPHLLLSGNGRILRSNRAAHQLFPLLRDASATLHSVCSDSGDRVDDVLAFWCAQGQMTRGWLSAKDGDGGMYALYGLRAEIDDDEPAILIRLRPKREADSRFIELTKRVTNLRREVALRQHAESTLYAQKEHLQVTLQSIADAVVTTDAQGCITYLNPVAESMTGVNNHEAVGKPIDQVLVLRREDSGEPAVNPVMQVIDEEAVQQLESGVLLVHRSGQTYAIEDSAAPIRDRRQRLIGVVMVFHDVTEARRLNERISYQATHDSLTGLCNREAFKQRLQELLDSKLPEQGEHSHALLYLDLDQFKIINDTCGHIAGDVLLRALSSVLEKHLRSTDLLARLGGDEFAVLLEQCPPEVAHRIASNLRDAVQEFQFAWEGKPFDLGVSIGLVNFEHAGYTVVELLSAADTACYVAKDSGRSCIHIYDNKDLVTAEREDQMAWASRIKQALNESAFCLYYQPIVPVANEVAASSTLGIHCEVLVRMLGGKGEIIAPGAFIPAAERFGLMKQIDRWVLQEVFRQFSGIKGAGLNLCSINLSAESLADRSLVPFIAELFDQTRLAPENICFEITETAAIANLDHAQSVIAALRSMGCRFALDDFGSGMASFGYLKYLQVDYLKIDGSFVRDMVNDPIDHALVSAIHNIGCVMGIETVAEFVEDQRTLQALVQIGVDHAQGYGIARPEPLERLIESMQGLGAGEVGRAGQRGADRGNSA